jgi:hypothetical protein
MQAALSGEGVITQSTLDAREHTANNLIWTSRIASPITRSLSFALAVAFARAKAPTGLHYPICTALARPPLPYPHRPCLRRACLHRHHLHHGRADAVTAWRARAWRVGASRVGAWVGWALCPGMVCRSMARRGKGPPHHSSASFLVAIPSRYSSRAIPSHYSSPPYLPTI